MIPLAETQYAELAAIAEEDAGLYMPATKRSFVASRLQRRLRETGVEDFSAYLRLIKSEKTEGVSERQAFIAALTTNVTAVYREPHHFALLADHLHKHAPKHGTGKYRIWSAGCSTGEEPLSIAAVCQAILGPSWIRIVEILATDVDQGVLSKARNQGTDDKLVADLMSLPESVLEKARALPSRRRTLSVPELQEAIVYRQHNLLHTLDKTDPFHAIFCRNVTIYFGRSSQEAAQKSLRENLRPDGLLAIGHSEQLLGKDPSMMPAGRTAFRRTVPTTNENSSGKAGDAWL